jgi:hypothetical protein
VAENATSHPWPPKALCGSIVTCRRTPRCGGPHPAGRPGSVAELKLRWAALSSPRFRAPLRNRIAPQGLHTRCSRPADPRRLMGRPARTARPHARIPRRRRDSGVRPGPGRHRGRGAKQAAPRPQWRSDRTRYMGGNLACLAGPRRRPLHQLCPNTRPMMLSMTPSPDGAGHASVPPDPSWQRTAPGHSPEFGR